MISTKGRYALRVMLDLAEHGNEGYIPLKDIAKRQAISDKYGKYPEVSCKTKDVKRTAW